MTKRDLIKNLSFQFWVNYLTAFNLFLAVFGLFIIFFGDSFFFSWWNSAAANAYFGGSMDPNSIKLKQLLFGIIGATIFGNSLLNAMICNFALRYGQKWAYVALWVGLLAWFVVDSTQSIYHRAFFNVYLINIFPLLGIGVPLWIIRKYFFK